MTAGVTVSGPGIDRRADSAAVGLSAAITYANRSALAGVEASYYVRDGDGQVVGRADADGSRGVQVYGPAARGRAGSPSQRAPAEPESPGPDEEEAEMPKGTSTPADDLHAEVKKVSAKQATIQVMKRAGEPLKADEIARRVLKTKGVQLGGKTPGATIAAMLAVENKKSDGLFVRVSPGTYDLRAAAAQKEKVTA